MKGAGSNASAPRALRFARPLRLCVTVAVLALIGLVAGWVVAGELSTVRVVLAAAVTLPLWLALSPLAAGRRRTYAWMTLAVVPYLVLAITEAIANPQQRLWAGACLFTGFALFATLIAYLRVTRPAEEA